MGKFLYVVYGMVVIAQLILHYAGWAFILFGVVALCFGNMPRGFDLLVRGVAFIVLKYLIGFLVVVVVFIHAKMTGGEEGIEE